MSETAIAIRYHPSFPAPLLIAKGQGHHARKIKDLALQHDIPIKEDEPLAQGLMQVPVGQFIPEEYFGVMAKILAAVFTLEGVHRKGEE